MQILDQIPIRAFFLLTISVALLCIEGGFRLGCRNAAKEHETSVASMVGSMLSLLAFMLAFTFGLAAARYDTRKILVMEESNAIGTTYFRADFIEEPFRTNIKSLVRKYVDIRVKDVFQNDALEPTLAKGEVIQDQLWQQATIVGQKHPESETVALFIESLNQMIDLHAKRLATRLQARIPPSIWYALFLIAALSMAGNGYKCGIVGGRSVVASLMLAIAFSTVILLIADLDRPWAGIINASSQPMIDLSKKIGLPN